MTPIPPDNALLAAGIEYLETQLLPALEGEHRFKTRLLINTLKIVARRQEAVEAATAPASPHGDDEAATQLAKAIRSKAVALDDAALLAQLESMLQLDLRINNPKWVDPNPASDSNNN